VAQSASSGSDAKLVPLQNGSVEGAPDVGFTVEVGAALTDAAGAVTEGTAGALADGGGAVVTGASPLDDSCEHAAKNNRTKRRFMLSLLRVDGHSGV
jgi:hypothetical protein